MLECLQQQQQRQMVQQQQQTVGVGAGGAGNTVVVSGGLRQQSVAVIRGHIPSGLNPQQQLQWLQQQRHQQQIVIQQNTQLRQQVLVQSQQQAERQMPSQQLITNNNSAVLSQPQQPVLQTPSWAQQPNDTQLQGQAGPQQQQIAQMRQQQQQLQLHRFQQLHQKQQVSTGGVRLSHPTTPQPMLYNNQHKDWPQLFENLLWSDEAVFHTGGFVNRHNCHYWAPRDTDPKMTVEKLQTCTKVTVWCGMTAAKLQSISCAGWTKHFLGVGWDGMDCTNGLQKVQEKIYKSKLHKLEGLENRIEEVITNIPIDFLQRSVN
ncbi:hypothetical protein J6590_009610 [Homalodisca vitripennis]|nr:hypothetical protein J6590_009610 [Homalodisca vitripennis]